MNSSWVDARTHYDTLIHEDNDPLSPKTTPLRKGARYARTYPEHIPYRAHRAG